MVVREALGRIAGELLPSLAEAADPDAAAAGLADYLEARAGRAMFLDYLGEDPRAMHVLTTVFGSSPWLGEILVRNPEYFHWLVPQIERSAPDRQDLDDDLDTMLATTGDAVDTLTVIKRWKRRELLRIGTSDLLRRETLPSIMGQLSDVAEVIVSRLLDLARPATHSGEHLGSFVVVALGQLGGRELSYAPDIELMYVFDTPQPDAAGPREYFQKLGANLTATLGEQRDAADEPLYRVTDVIFHSLRDSRAYYSSRGGSADRLMLLKARPIAGDPELGGRFRDAIRPFVFREDASGDGAAVEGGGSPEACIDRCVQRLQLKHGGPHAAAQAPGTLDALNALGAAGVIDGGVCRELAHAYEFLKSAAHRRQLMPDDRSPASEIVEKQVREYQDRVMELTCTL